MSKAKIKLKTRDYTILKHIYDYRFLDSELLWHLLKSDNQLQSITYSSGKDGKKRPVKYGFGRQALYKRLKQLFDSKYVERHYLTDLPYGRGYGSPRAIYGLGRNSSKILKAVYQIPQKTTNRIIENNRVKSPYLRHALELATFRIILEFACQLSNGQVNLFFWEQGLFIKDYVYGYNGNGTKERFTIYADAFFGIQNGNKAKHYFLEIDRGTEPIVSNSDRSNIRRKLIGYQYYHKSKRILENYSYKISGFQVLIVTPGKIEANKTLSGRIANIFGELSASRNIYSTKALFLLTTPEPLNLANPESIFAEIWVSLKSPNNLLSLIE